MQLTINDSFFTISTEDNRSLRIENGDSFSEEQISFVRAIVETIFFESLVYKALNENGKIRIVWKHTDRPFGTPKGLLGTRNSIIYSKDEIEFFRIRSKINKKNITSSFLQPIGVDSWSGCIDGDDSIKKYLTGAGSSQIQQENLAKRNEEYQLMLNTIKYGPPGTGKTYSLINDIKTLLQLTEKEDETEISSIADLKHRFGHRIEFLTFHQSYSYEDFIEGIKAEITETQQVNYAVKNGIFKKISRRAYLHKIISFENTPEVTDITEQLIQLYAENTDQTLKVLSQSEDKFNVRARKVLDLINDATNKASLPDTPKYVLCIDEINRGNLSRIFGELITCIEKTKRHGGGETIPVTLPYSGDLFVVPDNLYIIGTMNTADRSLVKLDNAMRRRFNFELIKPDASLLNTNVDGVNLENFLNVVNGRIRERLGIDFELGHAYFMGINNRADFEMVIKNNIIPLLNEYFFNNNASVQEILRNTDADPYLDR